MCNDFSLIPKTAILGIIKEIDDLYIFFEENEIEDFSYKDLCNIREKIYCITYLVDMCK